MKNKHIIKFAILVNFSLIVHAGEFNQNRFQPSRGLLGAFKGLSFRELPRYLKEIAYDYLNPTSPSLTKNEGPDGDFENDENYVDINAVDFSNPRDQNVSFEEIPDFSFSEIPKDALNHMIDSILEILRSTAYADESDFHRLVWKIHEQRFKILEASSYQEFCSSIEEIFIETGINISHFGLSYTGKYQSFFYNAQDHLGHRKSIKESDFIDNKNITIKQKHVQIITFNEFSNESINELITHIENAQSNNLPIIFDLRANGGGFTTVLDTLLSYFLNENDVYLTDILPFDELVKQDYHGNAVKKIKNLYFNGALEKIRIAEVNRIIKHSLKPLNYSAKICFLVSNHTASCAEIFAESLRLLAGAKIIGTPTYGGVLAALEEDLDFGLTFIYPIGDCRNAKGERMEKRPIKPDILVEDVFSNEQISAALNQWAEEL